MKKFFLFACIIVTAALFAGAGTLSAPKDVPAAGDGITRSISVTGDADVKVVPDEVVLFLSVETWDKDLSAAKAQNDDRVKKVLTLTRDFGIESKYVQTDQISVEPRYEDGYAKRNFVGFFVRKSIVITLKDVDKFEDLLTGVLGAGATYIQGIQYRTTELRMYRDQARALALKAAKEKAIAMAKELGQKVGRVTLIHEDYSNWWSPYSSRWGGGSMAQNVVQNASASASSSDDSPIALGKITVNARVSVTFELE
jgi:hypothetical protein